MFSGRLQRFMQNKTAVCHQPDAAMFVSACILHKTANMSLLAINLFAHVIYSDCVVFGVESGFVV
jgi:hypothetical protein